MGHRPDWSDAVAHIGDYAAINGPIVLLPETLREAWVESFGKRELKKLLAKQGLAVGVVDFDGRDVLVMHGSLHTRFHPLRGGAMLVRLVGADENYGTQPEAVAKALELDGDMRSLRWFETPLEFTVTETLALADAIHGTDRRYAHQRFVEYYTPKLAAGTYAIDLVVRHPSGPNVRQLIRLRKAGSIPTVTAKGKAKKSKLPTLSTKPALHKLAKQLAFAQTLGGPPVLLPVEAARDWIDDEAHYDLACSSARPGVFEFKGHTGVAFEQDAAELLLTKTGALVMYRNYGDTTPCLAAAMHADTNGEWKSSRARFESTGAAVLFDPVNKPPKRPNVKLPRGRYRIEELPQYKAVVDGEQVSVTLARLSRVASSGSRRPS